MREAGIHYRREIDGLRGLAILLVVAFHGHVRGFSGAFVGVDIFLVISGYLITLIILRQDGDFSFSQFYLGRVRRIFPALLFTLSVCLVISQILIRPYQLKSFSESSIAAILSISNIYFWQISHGYFNNFAHTNPLLHIWSLSLELQLYIFTPIFIYFIRSYLNKCLFLSVCMAAIASFALAEWTAVRNGPAAFYLAPMRAWEFMAGSLCAIAAIERRMAGNDFLATIGLILIVCAVVVLDPSFPFPGRWALLPVLGTCVVILFATTETLVARLLGWPPLVAIGLISYSLYLWHQPLLAFGRITASAPLTLSATIILLLAAMALAWLTWRYIEFPFRRGTPSLTPLNRARTIAAFASVACILLAFNGINVATSGFASRLTPAEREVLSYVSYPYQPVYREGRCFLTPDQSAADFEPQCAIGAGGLLFGDSHAAGMAIGMRQLMGMGQLTASGCPPVFDFDVAARPNCRSANDHVRSVVRLQSPPLILLHARWGAYLDQSQFLPQLSRTLALLKGQGRSEIVIVGSMPHFYPNVPTRILDEGRLLSGPAQLRADLTEARAGDAAVQTLANRHGIRFISMLDLLCENEVCPAVIGTSNGFAPIFWDDSHLTSAGASYVVREIVEKLNQASR